ncbi:MAG: hypothetical protein AVDCRST_MAG10-3637 [uncultured Acidimicrobiales bacterium]|uniref:Uncharacterized protein n=1 Tax=uncultured Acidimicrobiales bacterium TaxID=310071 RepID=A0A6J4JE89_9ACTN|nr:MAG: hypothetical protein AVDCRST_MAG10-3637 [uncultured Acidimicrobiales bacterium]
MEAIVDEADPSIPLQRRLLGVRPEPGFVHRPGQSALAEGTAPRRRQVPCVLVLRPLREVRISPSLSAGAEASCATTAGLRRGER